MIAAIVDHVGPVLVAVSLAAAAISTAKWLLDRRDQHASNLRLAQFTPDVDRCAGQGNGDLAAVPDPADPADGAA